jgi:hypothetical protein
MITTEEALKAIDPSLSDEERAELAGRLVASSAALDAYYDSRPQLEQIIAKASGAGQVKSFQELNPHLADGSENGAVQTGATTTQIEQPVADAEVVESPEEKEIKELEQRLAVLRTKADTGA